MRKCGYLFLSLTLACSTPKSDQQSFSTAQRDSLFQNDVASSKEELTGTGLEKSLQEQGLVNIQKEISGIQVELKRTPHLIWVPSTEMLRIQQVLRFFVMQTIRLE